MPRFFFHQVETPQVQNKGTTVEPRPRCLFTLRHFCLSPNWILGALSSLRAVYNVGLGQVSCLAIRDQTCLSASLASIYAAGMTGMGIIRGQHLTYRLRVLAAKNHVSAGARLSRSGNSGASARCGVSGLPCQSHQVCFRRSQQNSDPSSPPPPRAVRWRGPGPRAQISTFIWRLSSPSRTPFNRSPRPHRVAVATETRIDVIRRG